MSDSFCQWRVKMLLIARKVLPSVNDSDLQREDGIAITGQELGALLDAFQEQGYPSWGRDNLQYISVDDTLPVAQGLLIKHTPAKEVGNLPDKKYRYRIMWHDVDTFENEVVETRATNEMRRRSQGMRSIKEFRKEYPEAAGGGLHVMAMSVTGEFESRYFEGNIDAGFMVNFIRSHAYVNDWTITIVPFRF